MNIKLQLIFAIIIPVILAYLIATIRGEFFAVEGWNSLILWFLPFVLIFFVIFRNQSK